MITTEVATELQRSDLLHNRSHQSLLKLKGPVVRAASFPIGQRSEPGTRVNCNSNQGISRQLCCMVFFQAVTGVFCVSDRHPVFFATVARCFLQRLTGVFCDSLFDRCFLRQLLSGAVCKS